MNSQKFIEGLRGTLRISSERGTYSGGGFKFTLNYYVAQIKSKKSYIIIVKISPIFMAPELL